MIRSGLWKLARWVERRLGPGRFDEVREFVYLDEVSVRSLLASTGEGGIPSETVDESIRSTQVGGGGSASVPTGAGSVGVEGSATHEVTESTTEVRNYDLIQSKFTKLHKSDAVQRKLSLEHIPATGGSGEKFSELSVDALERGDVIELRVNLSANLLFRLYQTVDYFADAVEDEIDSETEEVLDLIETSLGNSIPVIGRAIDYRVVEENGAKVIKHRSQIDAGEEDADNGTTQPLEIVTLLQLDNLWVDPIQTLFSNDEFVLYCRVEDVDIASWYPLKVTRAISSLSPETAEELHHEFRAGLQEAEKQLSEAQNLSAWSGASVSRWVRDIAQYTVALEDEYDINVSQDDRRDLLEAAMDTVEFATEDSDTAKRKVLLEAYTDAVVDRFGLDPIDQEDQLHLRQESLTQATEHEHQDSLDENDAVRIEAKTVALYW